MHCKDRWLKKEMSTQSYKYKLKEWITNVLHYKYVQNRTLPFDVWGTPFAVSPYVYVN